MFLGAIGVKLPQILKIFSSRSAEGLDPIFTYSEVLIQINSVSYNLLKV